MHTQLVSDYFINLEVQINFLQCINIIFDIFFKQASFYLNTIICIKIYYEGKIIFLRKSL